MNEGIELFDPRADVSSDSMLVLFGDHMMDVLRNMGNPNKDYYHEDSLFLNYLELGLDIMIGSDYLVKKIILHTNFPYHPHFGFYNRCLYDIIPSMES